MKRSKIVLPLIRVRPLILAAALILLLDIIYVNQKIKTVSAADVQSDYVITGIVRDKSADSYGMIKSLRVGDVLCYVNVETSFTEIPLGSRVTLMGDVRAIEYPMNRGEFNKRNYYISMGIYREMKVDRVYVEAYPRVGLRESVFKLRHHFTKAVKEYMPLEGATVNTLLFAEKADLSEERKSLYERVGVAHFLVISGLHISAVGGFTYKFFKVVFKKRRWACVAAMLILICYGAVAGYSISVIRALVMFAVRLVADMVNRIYDMMNALCLAVIINCFINPFSILNSAFAYSYMTVLSITVYITYVKPNSFSTHTFWRKVREGMRIPGILCLFMLPVTLKLSYRYSLASVPVNGLLAPLSPVILLFSFLGFFFASMRVRLGAFFIDRVLFVLLKVLDVICGLGDRLGAVKLRGEPPIIVMAAYYACLMAYFFYFRTGLSRLNIFIYLLGIISLLAMPWTMETSVSMLYVGQGECMVVRTGINRACIVDCGSSSEKNIVKYRIMPYLRAEGIDRVEGIFFTHSDRDHMGEGILLMEELCKEGIKLEHVFMPGLKNEYRDELYVETCRVAKENSMLHYVNRGSAIKFRNHSFRILWPDMNHLSGDSNADSLVMLYSFGKFRMLFTGDATMETEDILAPKVGDIDVLKVSHHGSKSATSDFMLTETKPEAAVISAGKNNIYHHPSPLITERLTQNNIVWRCTKEEGEVDITIHNGGYTISTFSQ